MFQLTKLQLHQECIKVLDTKVEPAQDQAQESIKVVLGQEFIKVDLDQVYIKADQEATKPVHLEDINQSQELTKLEVQDLESQVQPINLEALEVIKPEAINPISLDLRI
jgi:DNA-binding LytR/AlgR family response regulator